MAGFLHLVGSMGGSSMMVLHEIRNQLARLAARADLMKVDPDRDSGRHARRVASIAREVSESLSTLESHLFERVATADAQSPPQRTLEVEDSTRTTDPSSRDVHRFSRTQPSPGVAPSRGSTRTTLVEGARPRRRIVGPELAPGDVVGTLRIIRELGRGGMGTVMLARDVQLGRLVAVKLVDHESWTGTAIREAFVREAQAMARIHHPNVVTVHAIGEHHGLPYFVMEYVPGTTLQRLLAACQRQIPFDQAISVIDQVCRGLEAIHRAGALHCDVKPANILIGSAFRVVLADLGLSRTVGDGRGTCGGTPGFVAPELLLDSSAVATERVDIYALGALTYELLTGTPPFRADSVKETFARQLDGNQRAPSSCADITEVFDDIVNRALSISPSDRQPSAEAFRRELLAACDTLPRTYSGTTVHIVDDDVELLAQTAAITERVLPGAAVLTFSDPRAGLEASEASPPDITIVDLEMPSINGMELTASLKAGSSGQRVHVVMLTGVGSARDWEVLRHLGASGFLLKPVDEAELASLLRCLAAADL